MQDEGNGFGTPVGTPTSSPSRTTSFRSPGLQSAGAVSSLMRPIETHVRIMGVPEAFYYDKAKKTLMVTEYPQRTDYPEGAGASPQSPGPPPVSASGCVSHVHPCGESIETFFSQVVLPAVDASMAGQSCLFILAGPPTSGRTLTMYGNPSSRGLIDLTAAHLLTEYLNKTSQLPPPHQQQGVATRSVTPDGNSSDCIGDYITVTCSCYCTYKDTVSEFARSIMGQPVELFEAAAPLGTIPLARMVNLAPFSHSSSYVRFPDKKKPDMSFFVQFQVYRTFEVGDGVDGSPVGPKKGTFATITFLDLTAFASPRSSDLDDLLATIRAISAGEEPQFRRCALTRLLEPALVGCVTCVAIATLTGLRDLVPLTAQTIYFLDAIGKINQVLSLINTSSPPWLRRAIEDLCAVPHQHAKRCIAMKEKGCEDTYRAICRAIKTILESNQSRFGSLLAETEKARVALHEQVQGEVELAARRLEEEMQRLEELKRQARREDGDVSSAQGTVRTLEQEIRDTEMKLASLKNSTEGYIASVRLQLKENQERSGVWRRKIEELVQMHRGAVETSRTRELGWSRRIETVKTANTLVKLYAQIAGLRRKRDRYERLLEEGSVCAREINRRLEKRAEREAKKRRVKEIEDQIASVKKQLEDERRNAAMAAGGQQQRQTPLRTTSFHVGSGPGGTYSILRSQNKQLSTSPSRGRTHPEVQAILPQPRPPTPRGRYASNYISPYSRRALSSQVSTESNSRNPTPRAGTGGDTDSKGMNRGNETVVTISNTSPSQL